MFIFKLIVSVFTAFAIFFTDNNGIKAVAFILQLVVIYLDSIKKLWSKYKNKRNDNLKK